MLKVVKKKNNVFEPKQGVLCLVDSAPDDLTRTHEVFMGLQDAWVPLAAPIAPGDNLGFSEMGGVGWMVVQSIRPGAGGVILGPIGHFEVEGKILGNSGVDGVI